MNGEVILKIKRPQVSNLSSFNLPSIGWGKISEQGPTAN
jgi:hypothetical protein